MGRPELESQIVVNLDNETLGAVVDRQCPPGGENFPGYRAGSVELLLLFTGTPVEMSSVKQL